MSSAAPTTQARGRWAGHGVAVVVLLVLATVAAACTGDDGTAADPPTAADGEVEDPPSEAGPEDEAPQGSPPPDDAGEIDADDADDADDGATVDDEDVASHVTTTDGQDIRSTVSSADDGDVRSEAEVRVGEILSTYDGRETEVGTQLTVPSHVLFDFDEDQLRADAHDVLDDIIEVLDHYGDAAFDVVGHTDAQGTAGYNQGLSERRAEAVAAFLLDRGVDEARMNVEGRGQDEPVASNDTDEGRQRNRRVEIHIHGVSPPEG